MSFMLNLNDKSDGVQFFAIFAGSLLRWKEHNPATVRCPRH